MRSDLTRFSAILAKIEYPNHTFHLGESTYGQPFLQVRYLEPDVHTQKPTLQHGRKWMLSEHMTDSEVVQTALKALLTSAEHRVGEWFTYKGVAIFHPHFSVDQLAEMVPAMPRDHRK